MKFSQDKINVYYPNINTSDQSSGWVKREMTVRKTGLLGKTQIVMV